MPASQRVVQVYLIGVGVLLAALCLSATTAAAAGKCTQSIADLYEARSPAVVLITALTINPYSTEDRVQLATGSGFVIDPSGLVMTNSHVVFGAQSVTVTLDDGASLAAKVLGADPIFDLAILQITPPNGGKLPVLTFADSDQLRPGDEVVVIGNPLGLDQTITHGIVSAVNRILPERARMLSRPLIQTDAAINPGNSGGPMLDRCGAVVGVTSEILGDAQNIGFAIPSNLVAAAVEPLVKDGRIARPWFGMDGGLIDPRLRHLLVLPPADGFLVEAVEPGSPASTAGIVAGSIPVKIGTRSLILGGDVITAIDGIALKDVDSLQHALEHVQIGSTVKLTVFRDGKTFDVSLAIPERPLQPGDVPESSQTFAVPQVDGR
ncbi:MAG: S1C family serine protease [Burkholderiales bacterium]